MGIDKTKIMCYYTNENLWRKHMNNQFRNSNYTSIGNTNNKDLEVKEIVAAVAIVAKYGICKKGSKTTCKTNDCGMEL